MGSMRLLRNRWLLRVLIVVGVGLLAIQLVPERVSNQSAQHHGESGDAAAGIKGG